jgi:predicted oxidoreductase (fatty acid repression mutant protein)
MQRMDGMQRMDFETLVQTRKSVRGFTKEPVARAVIEDIIEVAKRAPSSMNTQPWHIHVLTGEPLEEVRRRNMEEMIAGTTPKQRARHHALGHRARGRRHPRGRGHHDLRRHGLSRRQLSRQCGAVGP